VTDISFLLVSLEDYRPQIEKILSLETGFSYEIIVCSNHFYDEYTDNKTVIFVEDKEKSGSCSAFNQAYKNSSGEYLITVTGVIIPPDNVYETILELKHQEKNNCKLVITSLSCSTGTVCPVPRGFPGRLPGSAGARKSVEVLRWPAFSKKTIEKYLGGNIWPQEFKHHYMDNWLGTYCFLMGEPKKSLKNVCVQDVAHKSKIKLDDHDLKVYKKLCYDQGANKEDVVYSLEKNEYYKK